jgi:hypothetical protein
MIGNPTNLPWAFVSKIDNPKTPGMHESISYFLIFRIVVYSVYTFKTQNSEPVFLFRIIYFFNIYNANFN